MEKLLKESKFSMSPNWKTLLKMLNTQNDLFLERIVQIEDESTICHVMLIFIIYNMISYHQLIF